MTDILNKRLAKIEDELLRATNNKRVSELKLAELNDEKASIERSLSLEVKAKEAVEILDPAMDLKDAEQIKDEIKRATDVLRVAEKEVR